MKTLTNYIEDNGHISFSELPFNEIDALIFSQLVYIDYAKTVGDFKSDVRVSLREVSELFFELHSEEELSQEISIVYKATQLLKLCAMSRRYANIKMLKYINNVDDEIDKQFSAVNFYINSDLAVIAYKGTDTSLTGIKESAMLSCMFPVPAQIEALYYLQETALRTRRSVILCGHSKGGNLATYAAVSSSNALKKKIIGVYEFDAPGFPEEMIERYDYKELKDKIFSYIPQRSIIGCMLYHNSSLKIVKSVNENLKQHQVSSWLVNGCSFEYEPQTDDVSKFIDKYLKEICEGLSVEDIENVFEAIFDTLENAGLNNFEDFKVSDISKIIRAVVSLSGLSEDKKQSIENTLKQAVVDFSKTMYTERLSNNPFIQGIKGQIKADNANLLNKGNN